MAFLLKDPRERGERGESEVMPCLSEWMSLGKMKRAVGLGLVFVIVLWAFPILCWFFPFFSFLRAVRILWGFLSGFVGREKIRNDGVERKIGC